MSSRFAVVALASITAFAACTKKAPPDQGAPSRPSATVDAAASAPASVTGSLPLKKIRTTSPGLALSNLDVQIRSREEMLGRDANDVRATRALIDLLLARGEYASHIADYERAASIADAYVAAHPESADAHLAHAATLGTFHLFARQLAELDTATTLKAPPEAVRAARATVLMAQGRFDDADALGIWKDPSALDTMGLATAAVLAGERGHPEESDALFEQARAKFHDVSPFPVAWMDFQRAALLERQGDRTRAKVYFEEAHSALPGFAHAAVHLAGLETPANALAILEPLVGKTDDPEVDVAYADTLRRLGRTAEVKAPLDRARARYDELVQKHALGFADHAAQFYVGLGHDPARALVLARQNAMNRATEPSLDLWLTAALLAGAHDEACTAATAGASLTYATPAFRATLATTRATCDAGAAATPPSAAAP
jgi:tetratricopeptide (TPR) repeat protein